MCPLADICGVCRYPLVAHRLEKLAAVAILILLSTFAVGRVLRPGEGPAPPGSTQAACHPDVPAPKLMSLSARPPQMGYPAQVVFDGSTCRLLLFGPCCQLTNHPDEPQTWLWDGTSWGRIAAAGSPPEVIAAAIAYDPDTHSVIMFGGIENGPGRVAETWAWENGAWRQLHPLHSPSARDGANAVYDEAHHRVVLFGGNAEGPGSNDTWTWDGTDWHLEHPDASPAPKVQAALAYDPSRQEVVLFGGYTPNVEANDTWTWNGVTWAHTEPRTSPPIGDFHAMAFDRDTRKVVLLLSRGYVNHETWTWDGSTWAQEHPKAKLPNRSNWQVVYDPAIQRLVLYETWGADGNAYGPTSAWVWTGSDWKPTGA